MNRNTPNFEILPFTATHIPRVAEIERLSFSEPWSEAALTLMHESPHCHAVVCIDGASGEPIAYGGMEYVLDEAELTNIATHPDHRRRGCAKAVLSALEAFAAVNGIRKIWLDVRSSNDAAIALYRSLGYTESGIRKNFYRFPTENATLMVKTIGC